MPSWALGRCARCGAEIEQPKAGRPRRYCKDACRQAAYRVTKVARTGQVTDGHEMVQGAGAAQRLASGGQGDVHSDGNGGM